MKLLLPGFSCVAEFGGVSLAENLYGGLSDVIEPQVEVCAPQLLVHEVQVEPRDAQAPLVKVL